MYTTDYVGSSHEEVTNSMAISSSISLLTTRDVWEWKAGRKGGPSGEEAGRGESHHGPNIMHTCKQANRNKTHSFLGTSKGPKYSRESRLIMY